MAESPRGFGKQLIQRLEKQGLSKAMVYKAITLQKLNEEVRKLGEEGKLTEGALLEIAKIKSHPRQKELAQLAAERNLPNTWVKALGKLIRDVEKSTSEREINAIWDFFFEVKEELAENGATKALLKRIKDFGKQKAKAPGKKAAEEEEQDEEEAAEAALEAEPITERSLIDFRKHDVSLGRGLDVGTTNICSAVRKSATETLYNIQRNAFIDVRSDNFTKKMLMKLGIDCIVQGDKGYVIGDPAFELANIFEKETRRPMKDGMISPLESEALLIVSLLIAEILGPPQQEGEICAFSVPATPIDQNRNVIYHTGALEAVLRKLGYTPKPMLEGHSVVFADLEKQHFTGIGVSCGGGMFNVSIAYRSMPALTFSTSRGGDWIDENVAHALGMTAAQVCADKESGVDLAKPRNRVEDAIAIYYRNLIQYTLEQIRDRFEEAHNMPHFSDPIDLVCAGGTSMIRGFVDIFREEFDRFQFPLPVREIRLAEDPLRTVARGCLQAALEETRALENKEVLTADTINVARAEISSTTNIQQQTRRLVKHKKPQQFQPDEIKIEKKPEPAKPLEPPKVEIAPSQLKDPTEAKVPQAGEQAAGKLAEVKEKEKEKDQAAGKIAQPPKGPQPKLEFKEEKAGKIVQPPRGPKPQLDFKEEKAGAIAKPVDAARPSDAPVPDKMEIISEKKKKEDVEELDDDEIEEIEAEELPEAEGLGLIGGGGEPDTEEIELDDPTPQKLDAPQVEEGEREPPKEEPKLEAPETPILQHPAPEKTSVPEPPKPKIKVPPPPPPGARKEPPKPGAEDDDAGDLPLIS